MAKHQIWKSRYRNTWSAACGRCLKTWRDQLSQQHAVTWLEFHMCNTHGECDVVTCFARDKRESDGVT